MSARVRRWILASAALAASLLVVALGRALVERPARDCQWALSSEQPLSGSDAWLGVFEPTASWDGQSALLTIAQSESVGAAFSITLDDGSLAPAASEAADELFHARGIVPSDTGWVSARYAERGCRVSWWSSELELRRRVTVVADVDACFIEPLSPGDAAVVWWSVVAGERRFTAARVPLSSYDVLSPIALPATHSLRGPSLGTVNDELVAVWCEPNGVMHGFDTATSTDAILARGPESPLGCAIELMSDRARGTAIGLISHDGARWTELEGGAHGLSLHVLGEIDLSHGLQVPPGGGLVVDGWIVQHSDGAVSWMRRSLGSALGAGVRTTLVAPPLDSEMSRFSVAPDGRSAVQVWRARAGDLRLRRLVCR